MATNDAESKDPGVDGKSSSSDHDGFSWYEFLVQPPFRLIGFFYRTFRGNRDRLAGFTSTPWVSQGLRKIMVLTVLVWIVIWLLAPDDSRNRLTEAIKNSFGTFGTGVEE